MNTTFEKGLTDKDVDKAIAILRKMKTTKIERLEAAGDAVLKELDETRKRAEKAEAELAAVKTEEVRRIRHLNRLATWAQQDPTGPWHAGRIQEWVLNEIKAALGAVCDPTAWQPSYYELRDRAEKAEAERNALLNDLSREVQTTIKSDTEFLQIKKERDALRDQLTAAQKQRDAAQKELCQRNQVIANLERAQSDMIHVDAANVGLRTLEHQLTALQKACAEKDEALQLLPCPNTDFQKKWGSAEGPKEHPVEIGLTISMEQWAKENLPQPCGCCPVCEHNKRVAHAKSAQCGADFVRREELDSAKLEIEQAWKTAEEYRLQIPTTAQAMVYQSLLEKYTALKNEVVEALGATKTDINWIDYRTQEPKLRDRLAVAFERIQTLLAKVEGETQNA